MVFRWPSLLTRESTLLSLDWVVVFILLSELFARDSVRAETDPSIELICGFWAVSLIAMCLALEGGLIIIE